MRAKWAPGRLAESHNRALYAARIYQLGRTDRHLRHCDRTLVARNGVMRCEIGRALESCVEGSLGEGEMWMNAFLIGIRLQRSVLAATQTYFRR